MRRLSLVLILGIFLVSCSSLKRLAKKPELTFQGLTIQGLSLNGMTLGARFQVYNPNSFDISVDRITYGLKVNDKDFTAGEMTERLEVDGDEKKIVEVPVKVKFKDLIATIRDFANKKQTKYALNGLVKAGPFELPFEEKGEIELPILLDEQAQGSD